MLQEMRELALDFVLQKMTHTGGDRELLFRQWRKEESGQLLPYLLEGRRAVEKALVLEADPNDPELAHLVLMDVSDENQYHFPFVKPSGSQSPQVGPVLKRSWSSKKGAGPAAKILRSTIAKFREEAEKDVTSNPHVTFFQETVALLQRDKLVWGDTIVSRNELGAESLLEVAVQVPGSSVSKPVFLAIRDKNGNHPGERAEYRAYLMEILAEERYTTKDATSHPGRCLLCDQQSLLYPNALRGAGFNFTNVDRHGAFAGMQVKEAWKRQGFCGVCADLLTLYRNEVMPYFFAKLAGEEALVLPNLRSDTSLRREFFDEFQGWLAQSQKGVQEAESSLFEWLKEEEALVSVTFLWGQLRGQYVGEISGHLTQVIPSRLRELSELNEQANGWEHPVFPQKIHPQARWSLAYSTLALVLRLEGRTKAQRDADQVRQGKLKRALMAALLHHRRAHALIEEFQNELYKALQCHFRKALNAQNKEQVITTILYEHSYSSPKATPTLASWVRQTAQVLQYLRTTGVFSMIKPEDAFLPVSKRLQPFFGVESGIDSREKAFAFLIGALYGQLMHEQRRRQVNVAANALSWVKRYQLDSWELQELWVKTVSKLSEYDLVDDRSYSELEAQKIPQEERYLKLHVYELNEEISRLGVELGEHIEMERMTTNYFLLLGQSLARDIRYTKSETSSITTPSSEGE